MAMMNVEAYQYEDQQKEELKSTEKADKTIDDIANEPVDANAERSIKSVGDFFHSLQKEKHLFTPQKEEVKENLDLNERVKKLEEKVQMMESMQMGLESGIMADNQLNALLRKGSVNYNPEAMGKQVFANEGDSVENAYL